MELDLKGLREYQKRTRITAIYPDETQVIYPLLGLGGEVGELQNKLKKILRDQNVTVLSRHTISASVLEYVEDELGDILWYIARLADDMGLDLSQIGQKNLDKLRDRMERGVISGSGDKR